MFSVFSVNAAESPASVTPVTTGDIIELDTYVVHGVQASLIDAQEIKQNSPQFVDSIVAQDIGKLPDNTVADALSRVPGIQVARDNGEVNSVVIRGLPNLGTTVNGHEIFTGTGRGVALQDLPAELVAGVDVYKSNAPNQIEGGIAGLIDIRLRRPFDFDGPTFGASARLVDGENAESTSWLASFTTSNRWDLDNGGEAGLLFGAAYNDRYFADQRVFNFLWEPTGIDPALAGGNTEVDLPVTAGSLLTPGHRERSAYALSTQWAPNENLEIYSDFLYTGYRNDREVYFFIGFPRFGAFQSVELNPGTSVPSRVVSTNNFHLTSTQAFDDQTDGYQWVGGANWKNDNVTYTAEVVYNFNKIQNRAVIVDTQFVVPPGDTATFSFDLNPPSGTNVDITGVDVTDGDNFRFWGLFDNRQRFASEQYAVLGKMNYEVGSGFLTNVETGLRYSERDAGSRASSRNDIAPAAGRGVQETNSVSGFGGPAPDGLFSLNQFGASNWFGGDPDFQRNNPDTIRGVFGLPNGPPPFNPATAFDDVEKTYSAYVQAGYTTELGDKSLKGIFGLRIVKTDQELSGFTPQNDPIDGGRDETNILPTFNGRLELTDNVLLRFSAGRAITRPNFGDLNPVVNLNAPTTTGGALGTGNGGNPNLDDVVSDNFDFSIENYFGPSSYVSLTGFYRLIDGYVESFASQETIDGVGYIVTRPRNTGDGELKGFEFTYQQFFESLPAPFDGFGIQTNYTYITGDRDTPDTTPGAPVGAMITQPYAQVSKNSYNIVGIYERGRFSARLGYNKRGPYVDTFNGPNTPASGLRTIRVKGTDWLVLNLSYNINDNFTVTFDATNLLDSKYQDYFGTNASVYPRDTRLFDRTLELGVRYRY